MKKFICGLLVGIILSIGITTYAVPEIKSAIFASDIKLVVDGKTLDTQIVSVIKTGEVNTTNYVSARALAESLGATVEWDGKAKSINVSTGETEAVSSVSAPVISKVEYVANMPFPVDSTDDSGMPVYLVHGKFYGIAISDINKAAEANGYKLFNGDNRTIYISQGNTAILKDIPTSVYSSKGFVDYEYFKANVKPIIAP
jgi:hypothetical protein